MRSTSVSREPRDATPADPDEPPADPPDRPSRVRIGVVGGAVATLVMTAYRLPISRSLPPTATFWAKYVSGGDPADHPLAAVVLHVAYGVGAGLPFAVVAARLTGGSERATERRNVVAGVVYGVLLSLFGERVVLERVLGQDLDPDERLVFHLGHVVYGLTLGTWVGSRSWE